MILMILISKNEHDEDKCEAKNETKKPRQVDKLLIDIHARAGHFLAGNHSKKLPPTDQPWHMAYHMA
jgi:hypothetical protein